MKKFILIIAIFITVGASAQVTKATLQASGLTCAMCSKAVYKALSGVSFVEKVEPNIKLSTYEIHFRPGAVVNFDILNKAVVNAGFSIAQLKVITRFNNAKVGNDSHVTIDNQMYHFVNVPQQVLNGEKTVSIIDKDFITAKEYKKYEKLTSMKCYQSGTMDGQRVYHVTM